MRAKQFFYVCAGILMLAISYYHILPVARASVSSQQGAAVSEYGDVAVATNGDVYSKIETGGVWEFEVNAFGGPPPGSPIVAIHRVFSGSSSVQAYVYLENGEFYVVDGAYGVPGPNWIRLGGGNLFEYLPDRQGPIVSLNFSGFLGTQGLAVMLTSGDVFVGRLNAAFAEESFRGNVFSGTVQVEDTSITDVKEKFREEE